MKPEPLQFVCVAVCGRDLLPHGRRSTAGEIAHVY